MNTSKPGFARRAVAMGGLTVAVTLATPVTAFAAGADILIPKPAEFVPALIAFLVIWLILAKIAWPMIMKTLDDREKKIGDDLKAAEDARAEAEEKTRSCDDRISAAEREAADIIAADAIDSERKKAMVELSGQVVDLSVEIATKIIGDALDEKEQHELAEKYLMEVGDLNED